MWKNKTPAIIIALTIFFLSGCFSIKPTYTKEEIVESITKLCLQEYKIEPKVWLLGETVWIYMPLPRLITPEAQWDKETSEKMNKVITGASRVLLSMNPRPQFMVFVASDTQEYGIDYTIITWIPDIVKYQLQFISRDEFSRRNVMKIKENIQALFDTEGNHIEKREIKLADFLAEQIAQRIHLKFNLDPNFKDYFAAENVEVTFDKDTFKINTNIKQIKFTSESLKDIQKEIAKIVAYVIKEYGFKDFLLLEIGNSATGEKSVFNRLALKDYLR